MSSRIIIYIFFILLFAISSCKSLEEYDFDEGEEHEHGRPVNVLKFSEKNKIQIDTEEINQIFNHPALTDRKVVAVSIIGAFRKGKSFFLDYCLRYLYGNFKSVNFTDNPLSDKENWIGLEDDPLLGFSWKSGSARDTNGIVIWSDIFLHDTDDGEKFAILLIDTQGLFDSSTSPADNSKIFALGTLISSVQIFNLNGVIQENQLQYLQLATDFAKYLSSISQSEDSEENVVEKPFQNLLFLMRDWQNKDEYAYGFEGGRKYIKKTLKSNRTKSNENDEVRSFIRESFESISCFLMPHPGPKAVNNNDYLGEWSELDGTFLQQLKILIAWLFHPANLVEKKIFGKTVTAEEYAEYLKTYLEISTSNQLLNVSSIYDATIDSEANIILKKVMKLYKIKLESAEDYESPNFAIKLENAHEEGKDLAVKKFKELSARFQGNEDFYTKYISKLKGLINDEYKETSESAIRSYNKYKASKKIVESKVQLEKNVLQEQFQMQLNELNRKMSEEKINAERELKNIENASKMELIRINEQKENEKKLMAEKMQRMLNEMKLQCDSIIKNKTSANDELIEEIRKREKSFGEEKIKLQMEKTKQEKKANQEMEKLKREEKRLKSLFNLRVEDMQIKNKIKELEMRTEIENLKKRLRENA